jgi:hypothetical protein
MQTHAHNILSIVLGTRYVGVAIFQDTDLRDWFVKSLRGKTVAEKMKNLIAYGSDVIDRFQIDVLVLKEMHLSRSSPSLNKLQESMKTLVKEEHIACFEYPITSIEHELLPDKANKKLLTEEVYKLYPSIHHDYEREKKNKSRYLTRMFEAIAMGIVCFQSIDRKQRKVVKNVN